MTESTSLQLHLSKLFDHTSIKDTPSNVFIDDRDQIWRYENELNGGGFQIDQKDDVEKALYDLVNVDLPTLAEIAADEEEELDQIPQETVEKEKTMPSLEHEGNLQIDTASTGKFHQDLSTNTLQPPNNPTIVAIPSRKKGDNQSLNNDNSPNGDIFSAFDNAFETVDHAPPNDFPESEDNSNPAIQETSLPMPASDGKDSTDNLFGTFSDLPSAPESECVNDADAEGFGAFSRSGLPSKVLPLPVASNPSIFVPDLVADNLNENNDDDDNFAEFHTQNHEHESLPTPNYDLEVPNAFSPAEIPSMPPPPAMHDVELEPANMDTGNIDDDDTFGAVNALSANTADAAVEPEIPSMMPLSMPPPPAMHDVELQPEGIVNAIQNDASTEEEEDDDGFGAFNALSSNTTDAPVEIPLTMPLSMPPPPTMHDNELKPEEIIDAVQNDASIEDHDGVFGAFNALSSNTAAEPAMPSMPASIVPTSVLSPTLNKGNHNNAMQDDVFGAFDSLSTTAPTFMVSSESNNLPSQPNFNNRDMTNSLETKKNVSSDSNNFDSDDDFGDFSCSQDVSSSQTIDPLVGFDSSVKVASNIYTNNSYTQSQMKNSNAVTNSDDDDFGDFSSAGMNMSSGSTNAITDAFSIFD